MAFNKMCLLFVVKALELLVLHTLMIILWVDVDGTPVVMNMN